MREKDYNHDQRIVFLKLITLLIGVAKQDKGWVAQCTTLVLDLGLVLSHCFQAFFFSSSSSLFFRFTTGFSHDPTHSWTAIRTYHDLLWINNISCQTTTVQQVHTNSTRMIKTLLTACPMAILLSVHISYTPPQRAVCFFSTTPNYPSI